VILLAALLGLGVCTGQVRFTVTLSIDHLFPCLAPPLQWIRPSEVGLRISLCRESAKLREGDLEISQI